ncbi:hypothetical protein CDD83_3701 [Cordyceps sp. RAO-2017]|nr:hypothetical protein CDD83_3701 [Cordyceps sp. RAO-2017]
MGVWGGKSSSSQTVKGGSKEREKRDGSPAFFPTPVPTHFCHRCSRVCRWRNYPWRREGGGRCGSAPMSVPPRDWLTRRDSLFRPPKLFSASVQASTLQSSCKISSFRQASAKTPATPYSSPADRRTQVRAFALLFSHLPASPRYTCLGRIAAPNPAPSTDRPTRERIEIFCPRSILVVTGPVMPSATAPDFGHGSRGCRASRRRLAPGIPAAWPAARPGRGRSDACTALSIGCSPRRVRSPSAAGRGQRRTLLWACDAILLPRQCALWETSGKERSARRATLSADFCPES